MYVNGSTQIMRKLGLSNLSISYFERLQINQFIASYQSDFDLSLYLKTTP